VPEGRGRGFRARGDNGVVVLPLLATQLLWVNLVTNGAPALALDPADPGLMKVPPRPREEGVITHRNGSSSQLDFAARQV
jgi:P-type Ca2+ transporter type 2C